MKKPAQFTIAMVLMILLQQCTPAVMGLSTEGKILKSEEERVFALFEEKLGKPGRFTGGWFYFPGLGIINENEYHVQVSLVHIESGSIRAEVISTIHNP